MEKKETAQDQINRIIFQKNVKENWLADMLGISPQNLSYKLHGSTTFSYDLFEDIISIFKNYDIIEDIENECTELAKRTLEFSSIANHQLSNLQGKVNSIIEDGDFDNDEKIRFKYTLREVRKELLNRLAELEKMSES